MTRLSVRSDVGLARLMLAVLHLLMSVVSFIRHNMIDLVPAYARFGDIANTRDWGWATLCIGVGLLILPRSSPLLILWQMASSILFALFALLVTGVSGLTWGAAIYSGLSLGSATVAYLTADGWFKRTRWPQHLRAWLKERRDV